MVDKLQDLSKLFDWSRKVLDYFKPYKPEVKSMVINYKTHASEINLLLNIPDDTKRSVSKVEIPAYQNFIIHDMLDESFTRIGVLWQFEDGKWKLDPRLLPASEKFLVILKGNIPEAVLSDIVRIQPALNRDQTEEFDRYWLDSMIKDVGLLEHIWHELNVESVNFGVKVGVERCFSTNIPKELKKKLEATQRWIRAGQGRHHGEVIRAWSQLRQAEQSLKIPVGDIVETLYKLTTGEKFVGFLSIDSPYSLGEVRREEQVIKLFPEKMFVEAIANLSLKKQIATGYLTFKKKDYISTIKESFKELL